MMMPNLIRFLAVLLPAALFILSFQGCAQTSFAQQGKAQSESCRSCHAPNGPAGARDFSAIYADPKSHHPVGVLYPSASVADLKFNQPDRQTADIAFFDRNGNGQADSDEIRLFGTKGEATVECASCHSEHGSGMSVPAGLHLRVDNTGSALCLTCHRQ
jgi:predicted CXXCH cytochrome family protein